MKPQRPTYQGQLPEPSLLHITAWVTELTRRHPTWPRSKIVETAREYALDDEANRRQAKL